MQTARARFFHGARTRAPRVSKKIQLRFCPRSARFFAKATESIDFAFIHGVTPTVFRQGW
jgi:hypothetical protein